MKKIVFLSILLYPLLSIAQYEKPILTLNIEMHSAKIKRIDTDAEGKYVLTCSLDKTAKLWSAETGKLLQTYRPPIGSGNEGMLYAAAISPNGKYIAVGGYTTVYSNKECNIYIFERQSGNLTYLITSLPDVIFDLEFSKDGQYLAAALGNNGIRIYKTTDWTLHYKDTEYGNRSESIAFSSNANLISVSFDGYLRLYNANFKLLKKTQTIGGKKPISVAFSPNGKLLAVGYNDSPILQVLDATTLKLLYEPDISDATTLNQRLVKVSFSKNGKRLIAGGFYQKKAADDKLWQQIRIWENNGKGRYYDFPAGENIITDIKTISNSNILFAGSRPDWGILDKHSGKQFIYQAAEMNNYSSNYRTHFKINDDGSAIGLKSVYKKPLSFHIKSRTLVEKEAIYPSYKANAGDIKISNWSVSYQPKLNEKSLSFLKEYEICYSVDIADKRESMTFGTNWNLYALDERGERLWRSSIQSTAWVVNIAGNNKVVAACLGDGTIKWYRMSDGELLLNLFIHPDNKRWVLWTPSGYYDVSAGAEDLIGWHVNQGADEAALYYPVSKFRHIYYRPDVIDRILETLDEDEALQLANEAIGKSNNQSRSIVEELPPTVSILSPGAETLISTNTVELTYSVKSPNEEPITAVKIQIDGRPLETIRGLKSKDKKFTQSIQVPSRNCTVSVIAENRFGNSTAASIDLLWSGAIAVSEKPNLYILAIGVADYDDDAFDLDYPDDDASAFVNTLQKQEGLLYNQVVSKLYTNKDATKDNILDGLDWLGNETTQHDVAMLFFAGHGIEDNRGVFYYLPTGADESSKRKTCIMEAEIQNTVAIVTGKIVVFMDACHSGSLMLASNRRGNPDISRIVNELIQAENGAVVFTSSTGRQSSLEDDAWGHGAFTKALIEGLEGKAEFDNSGKITCKSLDYYITERVKQLTNGEQSPTTNYPPNVPDFPISIVE